MIHIMEKSKKTHSFKLMHLNISDAKQYLYDLIDQDFRINFILITGSDYKEDLLELRNFFNKEYIVESGTDEAEELYMVNELIGKSNRLAKKGATINAIKNFKKKIEKEIALSEVEITFDNDTFTLLLNHPFGDMKLICDYNLTILKAYAINSNGALVDIQKNDEMIKIVNGIFRNQRYYYKKRKGE